MCIKETMVSQQAAYFPQFATIYESIKYQTRISIEII